MEFFRGQWISWRLAYLQIDFGRILMRNSGKFGISLGRMRSVVSVVSTDNFVTAARQGRLSLLLLRMLCQSKVPSKFSEFLDLTLTYKIEFFSSKFFLKYLFLFLYFDEFFLALFVQNWSVWNIEICLKICKRLCALADAAFSQKNLKRARAREWVSTLAL